VLEGYRFVREQRVAFRDFDYFRHVNNAAYIAWTETLRIEFMDEVVGSPPEARIGIIMAAQRFDYVSQVAYGDRVSIGCRVGRIGTKSFDLEYEIANTTTEKVACRGVSTLVTYDYELSRSLAIPDAWREIFAGFRAP
jgi:acyl-CoA thioester hydrolase